MATAVSTIVCTFVSQAEYAKFLPEFQEFEARGATVTYDYPNLKITLQKTETR